MKSYMLIEGSNKAIEDFEQRVSDALDMGYSLGGELVAHSASPTDIKFFQTVVLEEMEEDEEDEEEYEEEEVPYN